MVSRRTRWRLRRARPLLLLVLVVSAALLVGAAVITVEALLARHDLVQARASLSKAQQDVREGDRIGARNALRTAQSRARRADSRPTGWLWSAYAHLPISSGVVRETRGVIQVTHAVTSEVLGPLVDLAPASSGWSGRADLGTLQRAALPLHVADVRLAEERQRLARLPVAHIGALDERRAELSDSLESLAVDLRDAAVGARVLPALLGADRPTTLLVAGQNLAEERATGGLIGSFALVSARQGRLTLLRSGSDTELVDAAKPVVDLGAEFQARYGHAEAASTWRSANLTPDVPSAGAILAGLSRLQLGVPVDAVVLVDPVALADLLRATGPVDVPGVGPVSATNATRVLLKDVYARYPSTRDQAQRKQAMSRAFDAVIARLGGPVPGKLGPQVVHAVASGHLRVYATNPALQAELARSRVAGALPHNGPLLSVITQDAGGSKLDYYLERAVSYVAAPSAVAVDLGVGPETVENGKVTVTLHSTAPARGLPPYVTVRADDPGARPVGQLKTWLSVYLGPRSTYSGATLDGRPVALSSGVEQGLTVLSTFVTVDPGGSRTLVIDLQQPAAPGSALLWVQQPRLEQDALDVRRGAGYARLYG